DAGGDGKAGLAEQADTGEHQRAEGAGEDHPGGGDRRAGVLDGAGGGLAAGGGRADLLPEPAGKEDVVVGADGDDEQVDDHRQHRDQPSVAFDALEGDHRGAESGGEAKPHADEQDQRRDRAAQQGGEDEQDQQRRNREDDLVVVA